MNPSVIRGPLQQCIDYYLESDGVVHLVWECPDTAFGTSSVRVPGVSRLVVFCAGENSSTAPVQNASVLMSAITVEGFCVNLVNVVAIIVDLTLVFSARSYFVETSRTRRHAKLLRRDQQTTFLGHLLAHIVCPSSNADPSERTNPKASS